MPNLASSNHLGTGWFFSESQSFEETCFQSLFSVYAPRLSEIRASSATRLSPCSNKRIVFQEMSMSGEGKEMASACQFGSIGSIAIMVRI